MSDEQLEVTGKQSQADSQAQSSDGTKKDDISSDDPPETTRRTKVLRLTAVTMFVLLAIILGYYGYKICHDSQQDQFQSYFIIASAQLDREFEVIDLIVISSTHTPIELVPLSYA